MNYDYLGSCHNKVIKRKKIICSGSLIAVLNLTIDKAPTRPRDNARDDLTIDIIMNVVRPTRINTLANCPLLEIEFPNFLYTNDSTKSKLAQSTIFII